MRYKLSSGLIILCLLLVSGCQLTSVKPNETSDADKKQTSTQQLRDTANLAYQDSQWNKARQALVSLTRRTPRDPEIWFMLGNVYAELEQPSQAVSAYQQALAYQPEYSRAWHNMGIVQLRQAMRTFAKLQAATEPDDELHERANHLIEAVSQVMENNVDAADTESAQ